MTEQIRVSLQPDTIARIVEHSRRIEKLNKKKRRRNAMGYMPKGETSLINRTLGYMAEAAFARFLGQPWSPADDWKKVPTSASGGKCELNDAPWRPADCDAERPRRPRLRARDDAPDHGHVGDRPDVTVRTVHRHWLVPRYPRTSAGVVGQYASRRWRVVCSAIRP